MGVPFTAFHTHTDLINIITLAAVYIYKAAHYTAFLITLLLHHSYCTPPHPPCTSYLNVTGKIETLKKYVNL
jgi:hypothetical protein